MLTRLTVVTSLQYMQYTYIKPLCCTLETNMLYVNYISIKNSLIKEEPSDKSRICLYKINGLFQVNVTKNKKHTEEAK